MGERNGGRLPGYRPGMYSHDMYPNPENDIQFSPVLITFIKFAIVSIDIVGVAVAAGAIIYAAQHPQEVQEYFQKLFS